MRYELILDFKEIYPKISNMLMWHGLPMKYCHVGRKKSAQQTLILKLKPFNELKK